MNILEQIAARKRVEIAERKQRVTLAMLQNSRWYSRKTLSLANAIRLSPHPAVIAEFKRKSPSKGMINADADVVEVTSGYVAAGAVGLSVLTDTDFFGGSNSDLLRAREGNACPILRKEFILDPYQVFEAKSIGADAILLIAALLTPGETEELAVLARSLGLETILEVHDRSELSHLNDHITILGVNNRNLSDFSVSLDISLSLAADIPAGMVRISESGIRQITDIELLQQAGYQGFLIGEQFMATTDPVSSSRSFLSQLKSIIP